MCRSPAQDWVGARGYPMGNLRSAGSYYRRQSQRRFPVRLTPRGKKILWVILALLALCMYKLGRAVKDDPAMDTFRHTGSTSASFVLTGFNTDTDTDNEVLDEYFRNSIGENKEWPTTGPDFYTGIHAGTDVVSIEHSGHYTHVVFDNHPKVDKATGGKIPYSCTNGGVRVITGKTEQVTVAIKHWHQSRHHPSDRIEMIIECPAKDATALRSAIRRDRDLTLRY